MDSETRCPLRGERPYWPAEEQKAGKNYRSLTKEGTSGRYLVSDPELMGMTNSRHLNKLSKKERLTDKKLIEELFKKGSSFSLYPLRVLYIPDPDPQGCNRILISVPKKQFKKAVDRNKIKRRIREAYRTEKHLLNQPEPQVFYLIGYIYIGKESLPFREINSKLKASLQRLNDEWI